MKKRPYEETKVTVQKSRHETDVVLSKHGVRAVQWTQVDDASVLRFQFDHEGHSFFVRFIVDPKVQGRKFVRYSRRSEADHWARESRILHRVLYFAVKSRLEVIESGLLSPLTVWLPQLESGGSTVGEQLRSHAVELASPRASASVLLALPGAGQ